MTSWFACSLRELLRPGVLCALFTGMMCARRVLVTCARSMGLTSRRRQLLDTDRSRALGPSVERWYAQRLSDADGHTPLEIELVTRQRGARRPAVLTEWYELTWAGT